MVYSVSVLELTKDLKLMSAYSKLFSNYEAAVKYTFFCFNQEGYSDIEKCVSDQNDDFKITTFTSKRKEVVETRMIIEILQEEPLSTFQG